MAKPYSDEQGVMRISVGDTTGDGKEKEIMFVSDTQELVIYRIDSNEENTRLTFVEESNDKHNYPYGDKDLIGASFFDLDDIGTHSIIVETSDGQLKGYLYLNDGGSYFIKALSYDGIFNKKHDPGQSRTGVSYQYLMVTIDGTELLRAGYQSIANAYRPLHFPYMLDGVGRCQNYIEYFSFGDYGPTGNTLSYTPVIPNSQLIISFTGDDVNIELLLNPSLYFFEICCVFWSIFLIMAITTCILHAREITQDKKERKQGFIMTT